MNKFIVALAVSCSALLATNTVSAQAQQPDLGEMWQLIQQQQDQIQELQQQLGQQEEQIEETNMIAVTAIDAAESFTDSGDSNKWYDRMGIGGYAEHHYNMVQDGSDTIDAHRFVLYYSNEFSDDLRFFSEFELEHSLAGEGKPGEVELEQAFVEWQFSQNHRLTMGQYLLPIGILNETHEPDTFYGVERNLVESEVVPSTWWETGLMFSGELAPGLSYDAAMHSGLMVENFRVRSGRQKSALATADNLAYTGRIKYTGLAGLELSASVQYQTDIAQSTLDDEASAILTQAHLIYTNNDFSLRALYADWDIDNADFAANNSDQLSGWFIEPSYKLTDKLGLFARYSEVDPSRGDRPTQLTERVDYGVNYWLHPQVAIKLDYQDSLEAGSDAVNMGIGWSF